MSVKKKMLVKRFDNHVDQDHHVQLVNHVNPHVLHDHEGDKQNVNRPPTDRLTE